MEMTCVRRVFTNQYIGKVSGNDRREVCLEVLLQLLENGLDFRRFTVISLNVENEVTCM